MAKARQGTGVFRQDWISGLRASLGSVPMPADVSTLADHPLAIVRLYVAGLRWAEDGDVAAARVAAVEAIGSGELHPLCMGCQLLMQLGPTAGEVVPLVWHHLRHPNGSARGNAGYVLLKCCPDSRVWAEAAAVLEADPGKDDFDGALVRFVAYKLRKAADAARETSSADGKGST